MKITEVNIEASEELGLKPIKMNRLSQLVLIAGKNGSGKSRLLKKIKTTLNQKPTTSKIATLDKDKNNHIKAIDLNIAQLPRLEAASKNENKRYLDELNQKKVQIQTLKVSLLNITSQLSWNQITTDNISANYSNIDFVPTNLILKDCNELNKTQISRYAETLDIVGIQSTPNSTLAKIQHIQNQWFESTHQSSTLDEKLRQEIIEKYTILCEYIELFLNTKLDRDHNADATLFGFRLGDAKFSNGQKVLLQLCLAIYTQQTKLSELIIFLDEPENHLHPEALIEFINKLTSIVTNGQIWISTHSINLLAHVDPSDIWYIEDGFVSYSGNLPNKVLNGLIGNEEEISKLTNFLSLPAQMANSNFAFECLLNPTVVSTGLEDPQTNQIINAIDSLRKNKIKVLDFGAGKGRLLSTINDFNNENNINVSEWLDYYAFDLPSEDELICKEVIKNVYNEDKIRYFNNETDFLGTIDLNSFDLIVMCNVFHEINPNDWLSLFNKHKLIQSSLKSDGTLLIVEDQLLAIGEKAYKNGFLVFDKLQFKKLFNIQGDYKHFDARNDGRLKAHFIPANALSNISAVSRKDSIENLNEHSKDKVKELRDSDPSYKNGKLHGFWVQQLANSQLVLSDLK